METWKMSAMLLVVGMLIAGCSKGDSSAATDAIIEKYEQACAAGDPVQARAIAKEWEGAELTPEQSVRIIKASNLGAQAASESFKEVSKSMPYNYWDVTMDRLEELNNEYAAVLKQKASGKKVKDKMRQLEDKIEGLIDKLDDAKLTKVQKTRFKKLKDWYNENED